MKNRISRQFANSDLSTLTDFLVAVSGNIENALVQMGAEPGSYTHLDLMQMAMQYVSSGDGEYELTLEDFDPANKQEIADPLLSALDKTLTGLNAATTDEVLAALGMHESSRDVKVRVTRCLIKLGWEQVRSHEQVPRIYWRRVPE